LITIISDAYKSTYTRKSDNIRILSNCKNLYKLNDILDNNDVKLIDGWVNLLDIADNTIDKDVLNNSKLIIKGIYKHLNNIKLSNYSLFKFVKFLEFQYTLINYNDIKNINFNIIFINFKFNCTNSYDKTYFETIMDDLHKIIENHKNAKIILDFTEAHIEEKKMFRNLLFNNKIKHENAKLKIYNCKDDLPKYMNNNDHIDELIRNINEKSK